MCLEILRSSTFSVCVLLLYTQHTKQTVRLMMSIHVFYYSIPAYTCSHSFMFCVYVSCMPYSNLFHYRVCVVLRVVYVRYLSVYLLVSCFVCYLIRTLFTTFEYETHQTHLLHVLCWFCSFRVLLFVFLLVYRWNRC